MHPERALDTLQALRKPRTPYRRPAISTGGLRVADASRAARLAQLATTHLRTGDPEAAVDVALRAVTFDPVDPVLRLTLGTSLYRCGAFESALAWLGSAAGSRLAALDQLRGRILADLGRTREALVALGRALESEPALEEARLLRATLWIEQGAVQPAVEDLDRWLDEDPHNPRSRFLRAAARLEAGDHQGCVDDLAQTNDVHLRPDHVLLEARARMLAGQPAREVERCLAAGIARFPRDARLRLSLARTLAAARGADPQAARRAADVAHDLIGDEDGVPAPPSLRAAAYFLLGELAAEDPAGADRAQQFYQQGLALRPDGPEGLTGMGALMLRQGKPAHALPWLLQSIMTDPDQPQTVEQLARALAAVPDDEAMARWISLLTAGLPQQAPGLLAHVLRTVQEAGRVDAFEEVRREGHRMKNRVAVAASRPGNEAALRNRLEDMYRDWTEFLERIRRPGTTPTLLSPARVVRNAIQQAAGDNPSVRSVVPRGLPLIKGDVRSLTDALANLVRNALEASPPDGTVHVAVRFRGGSRWLDLVVTDEGPGIALDDRRRIFAPGYSGREGGSGLGLAIAQQVAMAHGGRILLASAQGGPTTFTLRLPVSGMTVEPALHGYRVLRARLPALPLETEHVPQGHRG